MPLYEVIAVTRMASNQNMQIMARNISLKLKEEGGSIRNITNLGDRVLPKKATMVDNTKTVVGRYMAFQIDANPELKDKAVDELLSFTDVIRVNSFKMKETSYIKEVQRRLLHLTSPFTLEENKDAETIQELYNYIEDYRQMKREFKNPKEHYLKHKGKLKGDFWDEAKRTEQYRRFATGDADSMEFYKS